ncbi:accessory Sec system protein Asp2 [Leuconostoc rapi]|uniref:accessory Sec system protein Asp2 n=1 Tax=Leuconostoc rapi TaxID=1406906 RepID=UPI00195B2184|nr:accessory Sec system protein Asp2 [Leuconostoc rapi]MBM7436350.1 accessory secretory protein Asp2 [Leuconostoc rapi]
MNDKIIRILQVGDYNWLDQVKLADQSVEWHFVTNENVSNYITQLLKDDNEKPEFEAILLTESDGLKNYEVIFKIADPYTILIDENQIVKDSQLLNLLTIYHAQKIDMKNIDQVIYDLSKYFFVGQYGEKLNISQVQISPNYTGQVQYNGNTNLQLTGNFGRQLIPILSWQYNIAADSKYNHEIWLEYEASKDAMIALNVQMIAAGTSHILKQWEVLEHDMYAPLLIENHANSDYYLSVSLKIQGEGYVKVGNLHNRLARKNYGQLLLGGKRLVDNHHEEIMTYFHPGDMQPPLNVYFSGYRSAEGFEGYWMMKNLGAPFLLIADPRLEGGAFYVGSAELENDVVEIIQQKITELGFTTKQLILSGLSMGTFGALYYANQLEPRAIIVGKPLVNLGNIAANEKLVRPNGFPTSLDLLLSMTGGTSIEHVDRLNQRFWERFNHANLDETVLAIAYMKDDDYDVTAYHDLLTSLSQSRAIVISKGIAGRHNDDSPAINKWFFAQYQRILADKFPRK